MKQAHLFISGFVQGVGFRYFVRSNAEKLGIKGWVKNKEDNRVEALFQGKDEKIKLMINLCNKGPFLSEVKDVVVEWEEAKEKFQDFETRK